MKKWIKELAFGRLNGLFSLAHRMLSSLEYRCLQVIWMLKGKKKPDQESVALMKENVTFIY